MITAHGAHLSYCTNIHPGEAWPDVFAQLRQHVPAIKQRVSPAGPFGVGLRLSARAAQALCEQEQLAAFQQWLAAEDLYVFTLNVFPYGPFHGEPVKEVVYQPDWSHAERLAYSDGAARLLAALLPQGCEGSLSTVPCTYRPLADSERERAMVENLLRHAATLVQLERDSGRTLRLALEPEPHCMLETTDEAIAFFERQLWSSAARERFVALSGCAPAEAEPLLRRHLALCFDACHAAVEFEQPLESLERLHAAGLTIAKWQISCGLRLWEPDAAALAALGRFDEPVYLHQTVVRSAEGLQRFVDLPQALAQAPRGAGTEWRVHFHVPIFLDDLGAFSATQQDLRTLVARHRERPVSQHLEVETYSWDVLPEAHRGGQVDDAIARELDWVLGQL